MAGGGRKKALPVAQPSAKYRGKVKRGGKIQGKRDVMCE